MKLISWNVNGLRACLKKGFEESVLSLGADIVALQEVKGSEGTIDYSLPGFTAIYNHAARKGYSGTAVFYKKEPISAELGLGIDEFDNEGRVITIETDKFFFITSYVPNAQDELKRIDYRIRFDDALRNFILEKRKKKAVILCGDLNVARNPIDLKNPKSNEGHAGYSKEERESFEKLIASGMIDSFRHFYPDLQDAYSWWSYMFHAREKNIGWRIDYFLASEEIKGNMKDAGIYKDILGSDHAPIFLDLI